MTYNVSKMLLVETTDYIRLDFNYFIDSTKRIKIIDSQFFTRKIKVCVQFN